MKKLLPVIFLSAFYFSARAQTTDAVQTTQPFGKIDNADLELKSCVFEKDANAEVLFEKANVYFGADLLSIIQEYHKRVKIFNDNGKDEADVHIKYFSGDHLEYITRIQAHTINLVDGKQEITPVDKKLIYNKNIDKYWSEITFSFPNVKPGSVVEYSCNINTHSPIDFPDWDFQKKIPVRYSELKTAIPDVFYFRADANITMPMGHSNTEDARSLMEGTQAYPYNLETTTRTMANIPSLRDEPYMSSYRDNVQSVRFQMVSFRPIGGFGVQLSDSWGKVGGTLIDNDDFGGQMRRKLKDEDQIITKAKAIKSPEERIAYIFNEVRNDMKWNGSDDWHTENGTPRAWESKTGNSTEINLILYHLLKQSDIKAYPMVVSTREHGRVRPFYTSVTQFNRGVVYVPLDTAKTFILDASGKYNQYNEIPAELLNSSGLFVDKSENKYDIVSLRKEEPVRMSVFVNAEIKANGKIEGTAQISSSSYAKIDAVERYKTDGEKKYTDYLRHNDNALKIASFKMENMDKDSLPLTQTISFSQDLTGSDENYIYLNTGAFSPLKINEFLSENRMTDVDFGYKRMYAINGIYKIPAGYQADALPKSVALSMPDKSFTLRRIIANQGGSIVVRYIVSYNVAEYPKASYPDLHAFFKQMHQMMDEQIVLKKI
ncbi:MAG TPA: DUF3857 domain-containing protein [Mucilaginibacter sp.]|nr:DUF3857 domain-containing protein [Mucilaginibacter sp.]